MTDRRTPLFPLQALRIADVRSPVACEKPRDAQLGICNNCGELCYGSELQFTSRLIPGHKRARGLNTQATFLATSANVCAQYLAFLTTSANICAQYLAFLTTKRVS